MNESVSVLDIATSELINYNVKNINFEHDSAEISRTARAPSSDTRYNNDSLNAESIVGLRPNHQGCNIPEIRGVACLSPPSMVGRGGIILSVSSDTVDGSPRPQGCNIPGIRGVARLSPPSVVGRGGTILSVNCDVIGGSPRP